MVVNDDESFHPYLETENEILKMPLEKIQNLIFFGSRGIGKYYQALAYIKKFSPSKLKYNKKMYINKYDYYIKISDIHFEIDMESLGCNCKVLWSDIQKQIIDSMISLKISKAIILCKNFHMINKDLLQNFKNIMLPSCSYIFLTEHVGFIPNKILQTSEIIAFRNIKKKTLKQFENKMNDSENMLAYKKQKLKKYHNIKYINDKHINNIIDYLDNSKSSFSYLMLREHIYNLLIYQCNIEYCIWYFINNYINTKSIKQMENVMIELYNFFRLYNYNYRPIFHLEHILLYIYNNVDK
jgi:hypothetical protein